MLSDDESVGAESETDCSDLDVDPRAKSDSGLQYPNGEPADGDGFGLGTTIIHASPAPNNADDFNTTNDSVVNNGQLRLPINHLGSAPPGHGSITHRASKLPVNTDITHGGVSYVNPNVTTKLEDRQCSVSTRKHDKGGNNTSPANGSELFAVPCDSPAFDGNMSEPRDDQSDHTRSPQPGQAAISAQQSDSDIDHLPKQFRRRATENICRKRPRTPAPAGLVNATSTVSASLASTNLEGPQPVPLFEAPGQEREICDVDYEMGADGGTDDSDDQDYRESDATAFKIRHRPHSRKRARRTKDTEDDETIAPSTPFLGVSCQAAAATSCQSIQESEEIPIRGYLTLKTIQSKVVYCLTFS